MAIAWVLSISAHNIAGSSGWIIDWICIALALATLARPWIWLVIGALGILSQILPEQTSLAPFVLTVVGSADLNSRPPARRGLSMLLLGLVNVAFTADEQPLIATGAVAFFLLAPSISAILLRSEVQRYRLSLEESHARRVLEHVAVAREMHDTVALSMSHIVLRTTQELHRDGLTDHHRSALVEIQSEARDALHELRQMLTFLRSGADEIPFSQPVGADLPGGSALVQEWDRVSLRLRSAGFTTHASPVPTILPTDPATLRAASLVVREFGANVLRHGDPADPVELIANNSGTYLNLLVSNQISPDGSTLEIPASGHGLDGLRERLQEVGGSLQTLRDGQRWLSLARIPRHDAPRPGGPSPKPPAHGKDDHDIFGP